MRWCVGCAKARPGKERAIRLHAHKMCEGCGIKHRNYGLSSEGKMRWCAGCAKARPGKERAIRLGGGRLHAAKAAGIHEQANIQPLVVVEEPKHEEQSQAEGEEFTIVCLLRSRNRRGRLQYEVKWRGYEETTWEPAQNIGSWWLKHFKNSQPSGAVEVCQANREKQGRKEEEYQEEDEEEEVCAICLDVLVDHQCYQTACDHQFHVSCMNSWLDRGSACPLCNQRVMRRSLKRVYEHH